MITVDTKVFESSLKKAMRFVSPKPELSILGCVKLEVYDNTMAMYSTNLEHFFKIYLPVEGDNFEVCFSTPKELLKALSYFDKTMSLDIVDKRTLLVTSGKKSAKLELFDVEEYPIHPSEAKDNTFDDGVSFNVKEVLAGYKKLQHSICTDPARPVLCSVKFKDNKMYATDGYQISVVPLTDNNPEMTVTESFLKSLDLFDNREFISISKDSFHNVCVTDNNTELISVLIDGNYPDLEAIIPKVGERYPDVAFETNIVNRKEMIEGLNFLNGMAKNANVKLISGTMSAKNEDTGNNVEVTLENVNNSKNYAFNPTFMLGILKQFVSENVFIHVQAKDRPLLIEPELSSTEYCVLMPVNIEWMD